MVWFQALINSLSNANSTSKREEQFWPLVFFLLFCWAGIIAVSGIVRPILPSNELRYISVAWEMWAHQSFIVPLQGALPYAHKPPLLFWLVQVGWWLFGVNTWWPRLVPELFALGSLGLVYLVARQLWPQHLLRAQLAPLLLMGMLGWLSQIDLFKFDVMVSFFVLASLYCLLLSIHRGRWCWVLLALMIALGILTKGPVCLLFIVPPMLLVPWCYENVGKSPPRRGDFHGAISSFYLLMLMSLLLSIIMALAWAIPAAYLGGKSYAQAIFWHQSVGRMNGEFGGIKQWYIYLEFLAWLLFPWVLWLPIWRSMGQLLKSLKKSYDSGIGIILAVIIPALIILSLIPVKSERYIIPLLPWISLLLAYSLERFKPKLRRYDQYVFAIIYLVAGFSYLFLPHFASSAMQQRYFWLHELSPSWGYVFILMGLAIATFHSQSVKANVLELVTISVLTFMIYNLAVVKVIARYNDLRPMAAQ